MFDGTMQPIAERLVYVHPEKRLNISIELDKDNYVLREKATLKIKVTDDGGKPIQANLGISVFDKIYVNPADPANILTHCYLTSQIRGLSIIRLIISMKRIKTGWKQWIYCC